MFKGYIQKLFHRRKPNFWPVFFIFLALIFIVAMAIVIFLPILTYPSVAPGADAGSFAYCAKFIGDYLREFGRLPHLIPYWYNNWEVLHTSPSFVPFIMGLISYFWQNIELSSRIFQMFIAVLISSSMFWLLKKMKFSTFNALFGAVILGLGQTVLVDLVFVGGNFARALGLVFLPPAFYFLNQILETKERRAANISWLAIMITLALLAHALVGLLIILMLSIYAFFRMVIDHRLRFASGVFYTAVAVFFAVLLCWFYLGPFIFEKTGWTGLPETAGFWGKGVFTWTYFKSRFGLVLVCLLPLFFFFKKKKTPSDKALVLTAIVAYLFTLETLTPVYKMFAFLNIYPFLGSYFFAFALAYVVATAVDFGQIKKASYKLGILLIFAIVVYQQTSFGYQQSKNMKTYQTGAYNLPQARAILTELKNLDNPGRMMPMKYPFPDYPIWWASVYKIPMVEGWYYSTTNQGTHIALVYDSINYDYQDYAVRRLSQMNMRFLLVNSNFYQGNTENYQRFLKLLEITGFKEVTQSSGAQDEINYKLFYKDQPSTYFMPVKETILTVGMDGGVAAAVLPSAIQGRSIYIDDYDQETLSYFPNLVLTGFSYHNKKKAEETVREYVKKGGRVTIDLNRMSGSLLDEQPNFLGVSAVQQIAKGPINVEIEDQSYKNLIPSGFDIPSELDPQDIALNRAPKKVPLKEFRYMEYLNLDQGLAKRSDETENLTHLMGYKSIDGQKVWFFGPNLFYHTYLTHDKKELKLIENIVTGENENQPAVNQSSLQKLTDVVSPYLYPNGSTSTDEAKITEEINDQEYKKVHYSSAEKLPLLASYAFSEHWKAYLDGQEVRIYSLEDLMFLSLPAGDHTLELKYQAIPVHTYSKVITCLALLTALFLIIRKPKKHQEFIERNPLEP